MKPRDPEDLSIELLDADDPDKSIFTEYTWLRADSGRAAAKADNNRKSLENRIQTLRLFVG
jgi:hypothetical protein